jgi:phage-related protein
MSFQYAAFKRQAMKLKKAKKIMEHLPSRAATEKEMNANRMDGQISLLEDFNQLTRDLEAEGFFKPDMPHVINRVMEIVVSNDGNAYRAVYTVSFPRAIYVLHAFQKKSKSGARTPQADVVLIKRRLAIAARDHERFGEE